ncbi:uncharacterized protein LOC119836369 [Zerene cesonia]|uniref:uncharacterized protein LOC119836369 n=1 Tax=Zerene cesonia TaxID=33412 RepID=UPI0018E4EB56|nr:uncharacterized protein LOC119836369 [Zerene cesonia]
MADPPPLVLCMDNINGDEVALKIEPHDDFRLFLDKAKSMLGFEIDINSITGNQPVSLDDNIYQFLLNAEQNIANCGLRQAYDTSDGNANDDLMYVLDDGTQIRASLIHFDNEDPLIDLTLEKIPFVKYTDGSDDHNDISADNISIKDVNIESPVSRWSSNNSSPKSFVNSLPFKLVCNNTSNFEAQFTKYLESSAKTYTVLNPVNRNVSPTRIIKDNFKNYDDNCPKSDIFTREDILNMFKDSPVTSLPYDKSMNYDKRKHVRKTDPTRVVHKNWYKSSLDSGQNQDCCICGRIVENNLEKMYLFDNEDQRIHRCSPQKRMAMQLKIICEQCLADNFKLCLVKSPNEALNSDEYLVIKNNQQYIFQNVTDIDLKRRCFDHTKDKMEDTIDTVAAQKSSSDVEIVEPEMEIDKVIDNLEEADEDVKEFLGKYQNDKIDELKCRFCDRIFSILEEVIDHCEEHKHDLPEGIVYPCPLCDYGYANSKWLKGHIKAAHDKPKGDTLEDGKKEEKANASKESSPVAKRTRSAVKKEVDSDTKDEDGSKIVTTGVPTLELETEVKQEALDSDDEDIWIVHTGDDAQEEQLQNLLKLNEPESSQNALTKHKCFNCSRIFPTAESLTIHKCRKRGRRKKSPAGPSKLYVPTKEDFLKRAQGRPRQTSNANDSLLKVRKKRGRADSPQIVTCHNCNESFTSKVRLKFHMQFHSPSALLKDGKYHCSACPAHFSNETELFDHVHFRHSRQRRWQCPLSGCGKTFHLRATLTKHSRTHTDTRRYVCVTCGKRFLDKQTLDEHGVTHLQIKPFQCHISKREHATKHPECVAAVASEAKRDEAGELSPTSGLVTRTHIQSAGARAREVSEVSEVSGEESRALLQGLGGAALACVRVVRIDRAFRCEYCEDVFYLEEALNSHRAIHKGVKNPFVCHICKVSFATYSRCTTHKTTHGFYKRTLTDSNKEGASGAGILGYGGFPVVKHFLCEDCGRSYLHWTYLQVHRRMKHANENFLFKCNQCELTFPNSWSVAYHRKKVHGKTCQEDGGTTKIARQDYYRIPCRDCEEVLPNKIELYKHRQKMHCDESLDNEPFESNTPEPIIDKDTTVCSKCGHNLHNANALQKHFKEVHGADACAAGRSRPAAACELCGLAFRRSRVGGAGTTRAKRCARCRLRTDLRHLAAGKLVVIEVEGLNLSPERILQHLAENNIDRDKVTDVSVVSFAKGSRSIIPNSQRALSLLRAPRTRVDLDKRSDSTDIFTQARVNKATHTPAILQHGSQVYGDPNYTVRNHDMQPINVHRLLQDGALANSQILNLSNDN